MSLRSLLGTALVICLLLAPSVLASSTAAGGRPDTALVVAAGLAGAGLITCGAGPRGPM